MLSPTPNVRVEKPAEALAETMNAIRSWLDHNRIEPIEFKTEPASGTVAIKVRFRSGHEAELFEREFA